MIWKRNFLCIYFMFWMNFSFPQKCSHCWLFIIEIFIFHWVDNPKFLLHFHHLIVILTINWNTSSTVLLRVTLSRKPCKKPSTTGHLSRWKSPTTSQNQHWRKFCFHSRKTSKYLPLIFYCFVELFSVKAISLEINRDWSSFK